MFTEAKYMRISAIIFKRINSLLFLSPTNISSTIAEVYIQFFEKLFIKQWIESGDMSYYKRYVDDILIIFDQNKTSENSNMNHMNNIHK
jgi:hypothetical protein